MNLIFSEYLIVTYLKAMHWQKLVETAILVFNLPPASDGYMTQRANVSPWSLVFRVLLEDFAGAVEYSNLSFTYQMLPGHPLL